MKSSQQSETDASPIDAQLAAPPIPSDSSATTAHGTHPCDADARRQGNQAWMSRPWVIVLMVLHIGFFGIPFYWKTNYSVGVRVLIIAVSILYTVAAIAFIYIMLRWIASVLLA